MPPCLLAACLAVEDRVVAGAVERAVLGVVGERISFVRTDRREADDVAVGAGTAGDALTHLDQDARSLLVRIRHVHRLVGLQVLQISELGARICHSRRRNGGLALARGHHRGGGRAGGNDPGTGQEPAAANVDQEIAALHGRSSEAFFWPEEPRMTRARRQPKLSH